MQFFTARITAAGGRKFNEDNYGFERLEQAGCWVVADGLGGHKGGAAASKAAVQAVLQCFRENPGSSSEDVRQYIDAANNKIISVQEEDVRMVSMRTTLVILASNYSSAVWGHVGDSRLYMFRQGRLIYQTKDHSVPQSLVDAGYITADQIRGHEERNRLLKALGQPRVQVKPAVIDSPYCIAAGDAFLLCTDGFWEYVLEFQMEEELARASSPQQWLAMMEQRLLAAASGEFDNYTAVAVFVR